MHNVQLMTLPPHHLLLHYNPGGEDAAGSLPLPKNPIALSQPFGPGLMLWPFRPPVLALWALAVLASSFSPSGLKLWPFGPSLREHVHFPRICPVWVPGL